MPIVVDGSTAFFTEHVGVEEAEHLMSWLQDRPDGTVDLAKCQHLHTSSLQVLMATRCPIVAWPTNSELKMWLEAALIPNSNQET